MSNLKKVKDLYANMYEEELYKYNDAEFKLLSFLRIKGGENSVLWFGKDTLKDTLKFGRDKLNNAMNKLESDGAVIVFTCKDSYNMNFVSNVYYICEYDPVTRCYITANTIEEIKSHALQIRKEEEEKYALKNNKVARNFVLEERLSPAERKTQLIENISVEPSTENQEMAQEPPTDFPTTESPTTENQHTYTNKISFKQIKFRKQLNNNNSNSVVVSKDEFTKVELFVKDIFSTATDEEIKLIAKDLKLAEGEITINILKERFNAIKYYISKNGATNYIGLIRKAIKLKYVCKHYSKESNCNFEQRSYNFDKLERAFQGENIDLKDCYS